MRIAAGLLAIALVGVCYGVASDRPFHAAAPLVRFTVGDASALAKPRFVADPAVPPSLLVALAPVPGSSDFTGLRLDLARGTAAPASIPLATLPRELLFREAVSGDGIAAVRFHGLHFRKPVFHLFRIPYEEHGPGFHMRDSYSGTVEVVDLRCGREDVLLRKSVFNAPRIPLAEEVAQSDPGRTVLVLTSPGRTGWEVWVRKNGCLQKD